MIKRTVVVACLICAGPLACQAQQSLPDAPNTTVLQSAPATSSYSPPTQGERFKAYVKHTYGLTSILEAGIRGGIDQARDKPTEWPQGGQGYADRFGSAIGQIAIRGTTEYVVADLFKEDIRVIPCGSSCTKSKFKAALDDTFLARKGEDGHESLSIARLVGPWSGSAVAVNTWYPSGYGGSEIVRQAGFSYGFEFIKNYIRELSAH
jgi:hypothetical protein